MEKELVDYNFNSQLLEERKEKIERSNKMRYDEEFHTKERPEWIVNLYLELDKFITGLKTGIRKEYLETYIKYSYNGLLFAYIVIRKGEVLRVWAKIPYSGLGAVPYGDTWYQVEKYQNTPHPEGIVITYKPYYNSIHIDGDEAIANIDLVITTCLEEVCSTEIICNYSMYLIKTVNWKLK